MLKKTSLLILVFVFLAVFLGTNFVQAEQITMQMAIGEPSHINIGDEELPFITYAMMRTFGDVAGELTDGQIEVDIFTDGALGSDREALEQLNQGLIHGVATNEGVLPNWYEPIQVLALPFMFDNQAVAWEVLEGEFMNEMYDDMAEKENYRIISIGSNGGFRMIGNNVRPLRTPEDFEGLNIRTQEIPAQMELVEGQGASATSVSWPEVYNALQTGVVDGAELPVVGAVAQSHHEVLDYVTISKHLYSPMFIVINEEWYQDLEPDHREAIRIAGKVAGTVGRGMSEYSVGRVIEMFEEEDIEVSILSAEEREVLRENSFEPVREWLANEIDEEWIIGFEEAVEEAREKYSE